MATEKLIVRAVEAGRDRQAVHEIIRRHSMSSARAMKEGATSNDLLARLEQDEDCDLIVVGKHGRNAMDELLLGSTTNRVIAEGSCDVLISTGADAP